MIYNRVGEKHVNMQGCGMEIIFYISAKDCTIRFDDGTIIEHVRYEHIKNKQIRNPNCPNVYGIGYVGIGCYKTKFEGKDTKIYTRWHGMFKRCYASNTGESYKDCFVDERWHNFQNFAKWYEDNFKLHMRGWQLDKDILLKRNKIYSPTTCCFVPQIINSIFIKNNNRRGDLPIGVGKHQRKMIATVYKYGKKNYLGTYDTIEEAFQSYKVAKESYIVEVAEEWKHFFGVKSLSNIN